MKEQYLYPISDHRYIWSTDKFKCTPVGNTVCFLGYVSQFMEPNIKPPELIKTLWDDFLYSDHVGVGFLLQSQITGETRICHYVNHILPNPTTVEQWVYKSIPKYIDEKEFLVKIENDIE
jgi:hypothetical protein